MIETFKGKTVLITGHTGFKGSWLSVWMISLGAKVVGVSIDVPTIPSNYLVSQIDGAVQDYRDDEGLEIFKKQLFWIKKVIQDSYES